MEAASRIAADLRAASVRTKLDDREGVRPGFKFNEWERKGVPIRIELGPRDLDRDEVTLLRRDTMEKSAEALGALTARVTALLEEIQASLLAQAAAFTDAHTIRPDVLRGDARVPRCLRGVRHRPWCGRAECEAKVKTEAKATIRLLPLDPWSGARPASCAASRRSTRRPGRAPIEDQRTGSPGPSGRCQPEPCGARRDPTSRE